MKYKVTFTESDGRISTRYCDVNDESQIIEFYGLNEPDVLDYYIVKLCE